MFSFDKLPQMSEEVQGLECWMDQQDILSETGPEVAL
jgi:hypothetical protein